MTAYCFCVLDHIVLYGCLICYVARGIFHGVGDVMPFGVVSMHQPGWLHNLLLDSDTTAQAIYVCRIVPRFTNK